MEQSRTAAPFQPRSRFSVGWRSILLGLSLVLPLFATPGQAADLETIRERGYLIVAVKDNLRPLGFRNEAGDLVGLEIDLARQLAADLLGDANAVEFRPVANAERLPLVADDEVDMAIARITTTGPRSRIVDFSLPYYLDGTAFVTRDPAVQRLADLDLRTIAVLNGSTTIAVVRSQFPTATLVGVDSYQAAYELLQANQAAAFAADASVLTGWVQDDPNYRLLPTLISGDALAIALPRGLQYDDLRRAVNGAIANWYDDGWIQQRITHWGLPQ